MATSKTSSSGHVPGQMDIYECIEVAMDEAKSNGNKPSPKVKAVVASQIRRRQQRNLDGRVAASAADHILEALEAEGFGFSDGRRDDLGMELEGLLVPAIRDITNKEG